MRISEAIRTEQARPRVEFDAEGAWYCEDEPTKVRIPWAEYLASNGGEECMTMG